MGLQSQLFRGDAKLEAAAIHDSAHVLPGSSGEHVSKIQFALFYLDRAIIDVKELREANYGKCTAAAVLRYKTKRNIINRAYQTLPDNIVGRMTMARLDYEALRLRLKPYRLGCDYGPGTQPHFQLAFLVPAPAPGVTPPPPPLPWVQLAMNTATEAVAWAQDAIRALEQVIRNDLSGVGFRALVTHYCCTKADVAQTAPKVKGFLEDIVDRTLSKALVVYSAGDPRQGGSFAYNLTPRDGRIYVLETYQTVAGKLMRPTVLLHEGFHFLDQFNQDFGGNPAKDGGKRYHANDQKTQLVNAYALSQFTLHIHVGAERFLDDSD